MAGMEGNGDLHPVLNEEGRRSPVEESNQDGQNKAKCTPCIGVKRPCLAHLVEQNDHAAMSDTSLGSGRVSSAKEAQIIAPVNVAEGTQTYKSDGNEQQRIRSPIEESDTAAARHLLSEIEQNELKEQEREEGNNLDKSAKM